MIKQSIKSGNMIIFKDVEEIKKIATSSGPINSLQEIKLEIITNLIEENNGRFLIDENCECCDIKSDRFSLICRSKDIYVGGIPYYAIKTIIKGLNIGYNLLKVLKKWDEEKTELIKAINPTDIGINYLNISNKNKKQISYIEKSKEEFIAGMQSEDIFDEVKDVAKHKRHSKIGRVLTKISKASNIKITTEDIEKIQALCSVDKFENMKIVSGEDIRKFYSSDNYCDECGSTGELSCSCMSQPRKSEFFDIYVKNLKMLVLFCDKHKDKIIGRALLWENTIDRKTGKKVVWIDRIYGTRETIELFNIYAKENKYLTRSEIRNNNISLEISLQDENVYPYLDTMNIARVNNGVLTLYNRIDYMDKKYISLTATEGNNNTLIMCSQCREYVYSDEYDYIAELCCSCCLEPYGEF